LYRVRSLEGETPPNANVLFPVVFENEASTPLGGRIILSDIVTFKLDARGNVVRRGMPFASQSQGSQ
jgi:hypothetical protein